MRLLIGIIVTLFASVWLALSLKQDPGYAMFSIGEWTVETSFAFLLDPPDLAFHRVLFPGPAGDPAVANPGSDAGSQPAAVAKKSTATVQPG